MKADALPDVLIIGDSHSAAIKAGCEAVGLRSEILQLSGNFWHEGYVSLHPEHGVWVRGKAQQDRVLAVRARLDGRTLVSQDIPIIASIGFHLGRIVPPFGFRGHVTEKVDFDRDTYALFASRGLVEAYVRNWRLHHIRMLRRMTQRAPVVAVVPPNVYSWPNYPVFLDVVAQLIRNAGVELYDPREDVGPKGKPLPKAYLAEDGVHGNARFGEEMITNMMRRGLVKCRTA
jgi:hypothetical protein